MRIIAGSLGGRRLKAPPGMETRPTLDRVRESLFMRLAPRLEGARTLDLFAGAGSLGLEALSRGAARCDFVESSRRALEALRGNIAALGLGKSCRVIAGDAVRHLSATSPADPGELYDLILADPPYGRGLAEAALERMAGRLAPGGLAVIQRGRRDPSPERPGGLIRTGSWNYGETSIDFYERESGPPESP